MSAVALLSKHAIVVADKRLGNAATVHETIRVKSAAWDDSGVLIYTTLNHLKYCLPNGERRRGGAVIRLLLLLLLLPACCFLKQPAAADAPVSTFQPCGSLSPTHPN